MNYIYTLSLLSCDCMLLYCVSLIDNLNVINYINYYAKLISSKQQMQGLLLVVYSSLGFVVLASY